MLSMHLIPFLSNLLLLAAANCDLVALLARKVCQRERDEAQEERQTAQEERDSAQEEHKPALNNALVVYRPAGQRLVRRGAGGMMLPRWQLHSQGYAIGLRHLRQPNAYLGSRK